MMPSAASPERFDVAIVGGGFSGVMVALNIARAAPGRLRVAIVERRSAVGRGTAYAERPVDAILNVPAAAMGAFPELPDGFARWLGPRFQPGMFVARHLYGDYLQALLAEASAAGNTITTMHADVVAIERTAEGRLLRERYGTAVAIAPRIVIASGAPAPPDLDRYADPQLRTNPAYVGDPWTFLADPRFADGGDILIAGSGLTALDVIAAFARSGAGNHLYVVSRGGRFPLAHATSSGPPVSPFVPGTLPRTIRDAVRIVRQAVAVGAADGVDWRRVMDGLRPSMRAVWSGFDLTERRRFLRHVRPLFDPHRHRAPAAVLAHRDALVASGQLSVRAGRITGLQARTDGIGVTVRLRGETIPTTINVAQVINCGGPANDYARSADPLVRSLLARGDVGLDATGLGLRATHDGRLLNAADQPSDELFVIGWPMRGVLFETTSVSELREHAAQLGKMLAAKLSPAVTSVRTVPL